MDGKKEDFSDWEQVNVKEISSAKKPKIPKKKDNNKNKSEININEINENIENTDVENNEILMNIKNYINLIKNNNSIEKKEEKEETKNIIEEYMKNKNILKDKEKLISFIDELSFILKAGNNIIIPFLDLCPILIKSYIESDLDEEKGESELKYVKIFELLKYNSFISREYLYPIYEYLGHIFYLMNIIEDSDKRLNKFKKIIELWNIFYSYNPEKEPQIEKYIKEEKKLEKISMKNNLSSFCFLGSGIKFELNSKMNFQDCLAFDIKIGQNFDELNKDLILISSKNEKKPFKITFADFKEKIGKDIPLKNIKINISQNVIDIIISCNDKDSEKYYLKFDEIYDDTIDELYVLDNYYGQIWEISIILCQTNTYINFDYVLKPYLLSDNSLYYDSSFIERISFTNPHLVKVNYINYLEANFDLVNYFLGIKPLIPFIPLINGIYKNTKINSINGVDKKLFLRKLFKTIIINFLSMIIIKKNKEHEKEKEKENHIEIETRKKSSKNVMPLNDEENNENVETNEETLNIQKYDLFVFNLILQLPPEIIIRGYFPDDDETVDFSNKIAQQSRKLYNETDMEEFDLFFNGLLNSSNEEDFYQNYCNDGKVFDKIEKDLNASNPLLYEKTYPQLYRQIIKELFIYNRLWSIREFFFLNDNNNNKDEYFQKLKLKYKQISYYTKSFEQPYLYPLLEINEYIPNFNKYDKTQLFRHDFNEAVSYNFVLNNSKITDYINDYLNEKGDLYQEKNKFECCLIKKGYHVKGELMITQNENNEYYLIFICFENETKVTCNKNFKKKKKSHLDDLCYGSVFRCPRNEMNRKIIIKMKDINLILFRNYFKSSSAIEVFTTKLNKSFYFNFNSPFKDKHPIYKILNEIPYYQKIKISTKKNLGGYYNKNQENLLFSLFSEDLPNSIINNIRFFNNYDLLVLINLLANRSFKDLYQYPVFPILYKTSGILENEKEKERDLSKHIGLQDITKKSEQRMELIKGMDDDCEYKERGGFLNNIIGRKSKESFLFNIHYSNPIYTSNYLIRIFPYCLTSIEYQGDGFDSPNRQFYSIQKSLENTLVQKSDLREFIPEMYYFSDLFFNKNKLNFGVLSTGEEIDDIYLKDKNEDKYVKYKYLSELKNYLLYSEDINISSWIDLIFGVNQEKNKETGKEYYSKEKYIHLNKKEQSEEISNPLSLDVVEFGLQPLKIFEDNFPDIRKIQENTKLLEHNLTNYKLDEFYNDHLVVKNNKDICFCFEWDEMVKLYKYINTLFIEEEGKKLNINITNYHKYRFIGNVLGDVIIYQLNCKIKDKEEMKKEFQSSGKAFLAITNKNYNKILHNQNKIVDKLKEEKNKNQKMIARLNDHYKQIKYIDYNPRLNLFLSYALDGYINLYVFPKCKLIRTIKVVDITKSNDVLLKVVLISNPYPMIFFHDKKYMYILSINGDLINKREIGKNIKIFACIDKNLGLTVDTIIELYADDKINEINTINLPF